YFYRPHREGTYMWHCHFEDVEHVQMGMTGIVFVRPVQDGQSIGGFTKFAYNDGNGSTGYHRHFAILLNEFWSHYHDGDRDIQEHVVGQDASLLRDGSVDTSYYTNTIYIGPGEARDVLFDAPAYNAAAPSGTDTRGAYNVYYFKNRDWRKLSNFGAPPGPGGM